VPRDFSVVVATAMDRDRARRYATSADLAADLEAVSEGRPIAARPVSSAGRVLRWAHREPRMALLASLCSLALLGLALAGGFLWASRDEVHAARREALAKDVEELLVSGFANVDMRRWPEAESCFARVLRSSPGNLEALAGRILVLDELGRRTEALDLLAGAPPGRVFEIVRTMITGRPGPDASEDWLDDASSIELFFDGLRLAWEADGHPPSERSAILHQAVQRFQEASLRSPGNRPVFHLFRASAAYKAPDPAAARSAAATLTKLWPESTRALTFAGGALSIHDPAAGRALLERATALDPEEGGIHETLGLACYQGGDYPAAERAFRRAVELDPKNDSAWNGLGAALDVLGRVDEARSAYRTAYSLAPRIETLWNLGLLEVDSGEFQAATQYYASAIEMDPGNPLLRSNYAVALLGLGELEAAHENYALAVENNPQLLQPWVGLSKTLLLLDWPEEALEMAEQGLAVHPASPELAEQRAQALLALGQGD
jgi:Flp pilus assembly protein TadD